MQFVFEVENLKAVQEIQHVLSLASNLMLEHPDAAKIVGDVADQIKVQLEQAEKTIEIAFRRENDLYQDGQQVKVISATEDGAFDQEKVGKKGSVKTYDDECGCYEVIMEGDPDGSFGHQFFPYQLESVDNG
ncbi:MAG: hypothetical protein ACYSW3_30310 [Planctomycetota bacterium]|jgi:hypothetical protein